MKRGGLGGLVLLCAAAGAGEVQVAEGAVKRAAALARPAVVTVITRDVHDFDLTGVVIAPGIVLTTRSPLLKDGSLPSIVSVRLPGKGATLDAMLLDDDATTDTALYKVEDARVKPLSPARSEDIHPGMWVLLVGNTFGQGRESTPTLGLGVVSAVSKGDKGVLAFHTSALVNPGSVGAPVVDLTGDLVGIAANSITPDGGQTVVIPYDAIRAAYMAKEGKGAKVVGRPPPPRPVANRVDDDLGRVLENAALRAARALVAVRALPLEGEGEAPPEPSRRTGTDRSRPPGPQPEPGKPPTGPPPPPRVPGAEKAYDRCSGLVVSEDGLVLTTLRITGWPLADRQLAVDLPDGRSFPAAVLGRDERLRLALLSIDAKGLVPLEPAPESAFRAGRFAVALGYPHMRPTKETPQLTFGILSRTRALSRLHPGFEALGTDAGVSESNRGGPLVDIDGRLLGILLDVNDTDPMGGYAARAQGVYAGNAGIGFAVPWTVLDRILPRLRVGAVLKTGFLGVGTAETPDGLEVMNVAEKNSRGQPTGAKEAGIARGDLVLAIDGKPVRNGADLRAILSALAAGDRVTLRLRRAGQELEIPATLGEQ